MTSTWEEWRAVRAGKLDRGRSFLICQYRIECNYFSANLADLADHAAADRTLFFRPGSSLIGSDQVYWVITFTVDQMDKFKQIVNKLVAATEKEPGTLAFEFTVGNDRTEEDDR